MFIVVDATFWCRNNLSNCVVPAKSDCSTCFSALHYLLFHSVAQVAAPATVKVQQLFFVATQIKWPRPDSYTRPPHGSDCRCLPILFSRPNLDCAYGPLHDSPDAANGGAGVWLCCEQGACVHDGHQAHLAFHAGEMSSRLK